MTTSSVTSQPAPRSAGPAGLINSTAADLLAFKRLNVAMTVTRNGAGLKATISSTGELAERLKREDVILTAQPVDGELFIAATATSPTPLPLVFLDFDGDVPQRLHFGARR